MTFYVIYLVFKFKLPSMASSEENCKIWLWLNPCHHSTAQSLGKEKKKKKRLTGSYKLLPSQTIVWKTLK